jgi:glycosyltransferase involved in cell wall biosynthesis
MPRLLILCEYPTLLGGERSMLATLPAVAGAGFDVHVAAPPAGPLADALRKQGVSLTPWSAHGDGDERLQLEPSRAQLARLFRQTRPDLVHANSLSTARISGPVASQAGLRSVGHLRDIVKLSRQAIDDLNQHRRLIAVSRSTRDFHVAQGIDATRCVIAHNGVDLNAFGPRTPTGYLHREFGLPTSARLVATIGQLGLRKGTDAALAAALQAAGELPDVHWLIVGERTSGKDESREFEALLQLIAAEAPLAGRVHFLGSRSDVPQLMNECVLLVHAARQEPLGRVLLEAAASGLTVVATDVGGTREIFPTDADGAVLVPPDNRLAIAEVVTKLLRDEPRRQSLGQAARRRAEAAFDIQFAARKLVSHYQKLLE